MFNWLRLDIDQRRIILEDASNKTGYPTSVIEKDWWVTVALKAVFNTPWAENLVFKGGTSLSKAWNLIERFSEDIDLAIDKSVLGFTTEELNKTQIVKLREKSAGFLETVFMPALNQCIIDMGIDPAQFTLTIKPIPNKDIEPRILMLNYQSIVNPNDYVQDRVLIEIGARSLREPCSPRPITSILSNLFAGQPFSDAPFEIQTVHPERTFLEKVCLLHEEFLKEPEKWRHERLSRHPYDLHKIKGTVYGKAALQGKELFRIIVGHRKKFTAIRGITYEKHTYAEIDFVPPDSVIPLWKEDYEKMLQTMIYGPAPTFEELIDSMKELRQWFRDQR